MRFKVGVGFLLGALFGFLVAVMGDSMIAEGRVSKDRRSMTIALTISDALERYHRDSGVYPDVSSSSELSPFLVPKYLPVATTGGPDFLVARQGSKLILIRLGRGGFAVQEHTIVNCEPQNAPPCR